MLLFWDASALVKRYSPEPGTALVNEAFHRVEAARMMALQVGLLEVASILVRKKNAGLIAQADFDLAVQLFRGEIIADQSFLVILERLELMSPALDLIGRHNLNATDGLLLSAALALQTASADRLMLWTSDQRLGRAARTEGLLVFDPEAETLPNLLQVLGT